VNRKLKIREAKRFCQLLGAYMDKVLSMRARKVLAQASTLLKTRPTAIITNGLRAYQDAKPKKFYTLKGPRTQHVRIPNIKDRSNNNMVERLHGTIRQRNKVMRGLDDVETAQTMMDGLRVYYPSLDRTWR
jgi:transposase-like protein